MEPHAHHKNARFSIKRLCNPPAGNASRSVKLRKLAHLAENQISRSFAAWHLEIEKTKNLFLAHAG